VPGGPDREVPNIGYQHIAITHCKLPIHYPAHLPNIPEKILRAALCLPSPYHHYILRYATCTHTTLAAACLTRLPLRACLTHLLATASPPCLPALPPASSSALPLHALHPAPTAPPPCYTSFRLLAVSCRYTRLNAQTLLWPFPLFGFSTSRACRRTCRAHCTTAVRLLFAAPAAHNNVRVRARLLLRAHICLPLLQARRRSVYHAFNACRRVRSI